MTESLPPTPPTPPTPAEVHKHLSLVQIVSLIVAVLSAVLTGLQAMPLQYAWLPPVMMILGLVVAALSAFVKAYNIPMILIVCLLLPFLGGCNATATTRYAIDAPIVDAAVAGVRIAHDTHKMSDSTFATLSPLGDRALGDVKAAYVWIQENPNLANVPGAPCPPLDDLRGILPSLLPWRLYLVDLAPITPPAIVIPPATQPAK